MQIANFAFILVNLLISQDCQSGLIGQSGPGDAGCPNCPGGPSGQGGQPL